MVSVPTSEIAFDNLEKTSGAFMRLSMEIKSLLKDTGLGAKILNADNFPEEIRNDASAPKETTYDNLFSHFYGNHPVVVLFDYYGEKAKKYFFQSPGRIDKLIDQHDKPENAVGSFEFKANELKFCTQPLKENTENVALIEKAEAFEKAVDELTAKTHELAMAVKGPQVI